jgi:beta-lactam-binding protein with PASTA domain
MVSVKAAALLGRPAGAVREYLAGLGLRPRMVWSVTGARPPGTVVSVQPSGRVAEGSIVTVAAAAPPGHRHHHGKDHGEGDGGGDAGSGHGGG